MTNLDRLVFTICTLTAAGFFLTYSVAFDYRMLVIACFFTAGSLFLLKEPLKTKFLWARELERMLVPASKKKRAWIYFALIFWSSALFFHMFQPSSGVARSSSAKGQYFIDPIINLLGYPGFVLLLIGVGFAGLFAAWRSE